MKGTATLLRVVVAGLLIAVCGGRGAEAVAVNFVPPVQDVALGDPTTVAIEISGLGDLTAPSLGSFDIDVNFNSGILAFASVTFGDPILGDQLDLGVSGSIIAATAGTGVVNISQLSLEATQDLEDFQASAFTLVTLTFATIGIGTSPLTLSVNSLRDAVGFPLEASIGSGSVTVNAAVPAPHGAVLLISGLAALAAASRRRGTVGGAAADRAKVDYEHRRHCHPLAAVAPSVDPSP